MTRRPSAADLLADLRARCPEAARRLDAAAGVELRGPDAVFRVPEGSWARPGLEALRPALEEAVEAVLGAGAGALLETAAPAPLALPLPVRASKVWNHAAFWAWDEAAVAVFALRKPLYEDWCRTRGEDALPPLGSPDVLARAYPAPQGHGGEPPVWALPRLLDDLCALARDGASYAQLICAFPGDQAAERLEARLYAIRDWGTPREPAALLRKYTGRLHYVAADAPLAGLRFARRLLRSLP